jgi:hypothetical protein
MKNQFHSPFIYESLRQCQIVVSMLQEGSTADAAAAAAAVSAAISQDTHMKMRKKAMENAMSFC